MTSQGSIGPSPAHLGPSAGELYSPDILCLAQGSTEVCEPFVKLKYPTFRICLKLCRYIMYQIVYRYISYNHHVHLPVSIHCISPCVCAPVVHAIRAGGTPWDIPRHTTSCCREVQGHSSGLPTHFLLRISYDFMIGCWAIGLHHLRPPWPFKKRWHQVVLVALSAVAPQRAAKARRGWFWPGHNGELGAWGLMLATYFSPRMAQDGAPVR